MRSFSLPICAAAISWMLGAGGAGAADPVGCPGTDPAALAWLERMSRSTENTSYHGVATLQRGDDVQFMLLSHSVGGDSTTENMTRLNGQGVRVERDDHPLHCVHPGHKLLRASAALGAGECGIAEHYRFSTAEGGRIAGRSAVRILVQPRDPFRYGYVMELDRETALLLKVRMVDRGNRVLERFQFANLRFGEDDSAGRDTPVPVHRAEHTMPALTMQDTAPLRRWDVGWLPGGFTLTDMPEGDSARRTFTDGLAVFSVFLEEMEIAPGEGVVRYGGTTSYTRGRDLKGRSVLITVLGEVPLNTARMVADSVTWNR